MRISGTGCARNGLDAIKRRSNLYDARAAISALHDGLLAVAKGMITPEQARDFFWHGEAIDGAKFFGDVLEFDAKADTAAAPPEGRADG